MNPLYKNVRGKVLTDYYSEYDLNMLGFSLSDFSILGDSDSDYEKACSLYYNAQKIQDKDLEKAALTLMRKMQETEEYGKE